MKHDWLQYVIAALCLYGGWKIGQIFWPLYHTAYWYLRRKSAEMRYKHWITGRQLNSEYRRADVKHRVSGV